MLAVDATVVEGQDGTVYFPGYDSANGVELWAWPRPDFESPEAETPAPALPGGSLDESCGCTTATRDVGLGPWVFVALLAFGRERVRRRS